MRYVQARYEQEQRELAYRIFVTESLRLAPQNKYLTMKYMEMIKPQAIDNRTGDEVAIDVIERIGLKFAGEE